MSKGLSACVRVEALIDLISTYGVSTINHASFFSNLELHEALQKYQNLSDENKMLHVRN